MAQEVVRMRPAIRSVTPIGQEITLNGIVEAIMAKPVWVVDQMGKRFDDTRLRNNVQQYLFKSVSREEFVRVKPGVYVRKREPTAGVEHVDRVPESAILNARREDTKRKNRAAKKTTPLEKVAREREQSTIDPLQIDMGLPLASKAELENAIDEILEILEKKELAKLRPVITSIWIARRHRHNERRHDPVRMILEELARDEIQQRAKRHTIDPLELTLEVERTATAVEAELVTMEGDSEVTSVASKPHNDQVDPMFRSSQVATYTQLR